MPACQESFEQQQIWLVIDIFKNKLYENRYGDWSMVSNRAYAGGVLVAAAGCLSLACALVITQSPAFLVTLLACLGVLGAAAHIQ